MIVAFSTCPCTSMSPSASTTESDSTLRVMMRDPGCLSCRRLESHAAVNREYVVNGKNVAHKTQASVLRRTELAAGFVEFHIDAGANPEGFGLAGWYCLAHEVAAIFAGLRELKSRQMLAAPYGPSAFGAPVVIGAPVSGSTSNPLAKYVSVPTIPPSLGGVGRLPSSRG